MTTKNVKTIEVDPARFTGLNAVHAAKLAQALKKQGELRGTDSNQLIAEANQVIAAVKKEGVTSAFAWEYAKVFTDPIKSIETRKNLITYFENVHGLTPREAAKMADCIVFSAAKRTQNPADQMIENMKTNASKALARGETFRTVADAVYYATADIEYNMFLARCKANQKN